MDILGVLHSFQTQEQAMDYLENVRWKGRPVCPYCQGTAVGRHVSGDRAGQRWQCRTCKRAFSGTVGTIFHGTHIELRKWFLVTALMMNAKKSASACQIARDLGMRRPTVWSMMHRIRVAMASDPAQTALMHGIVEADETYIGGKPRKGGPKGGGPATKPKRGRGTAKVAVIGIAERGGRVVAKVAEAGELSAKGLLAFVERFVDPAGSLVMTDEYSGYVGLAAKFQHSRVKHAETYAEGIVHTNTIEGFWGLVKRAWYGQHHWYSRKYMPLYIAEACYKYNERRQADCFGRALGLMAAS